MPFLFLLFIVVIILLFKLFHAPKSSEKLGEEGENLVQSYLGDTILGVQHVFNDYVILQNGKSTQIDHIVVNAHGIFVIETKNYSGHIYGSEKSQRWTQVLAYGNEKHTFYNPIKQNHTHIYRLKQLLKKQVPFYSLVVFVQNNIDNINASEVITLRELPSSLQQGACVLSSSQIDKIGNFLYEHNARNEVSNESHVQQIQEEQMKIEYNICPRCNAKLVWREGKYGGFWGCSKYPKCKFIKK